MMFLCHIYDYSENRLCIVSRLEILRFFFVIYSDLKILHELLFQEQPSMDKAENSTVRVFF